MKIFIHLTYMKKKLFIIFIPLLLASCDHIGLIENLYQSNIISTENSSSHVDSSQSGNSASNITSQSHLESEPRISTYIVNFDSHGGDQSFNNLIVEAGKPYLNLPTVVTKNNATFLGWWLNSDGQGEKIVSSTIVTLEENHTLHARWIDLANVIVVDHDEKIQTAIANSKDGDVIFVNPGLYQEEIIIDKKITLLGNNYLDLPNRLPETIITPPNGEYFNYSDGVVCIKIITGDVIIKGFRIDGDNPQYHNIWTYQRHQFYQDQISSASVNAVATTLFLADYINNEIEYDGSIAIKAIRENEEAISNITIANNIVTNFVEYGIIVNNMLLSSGGDNYALNINISNNIIDKIAGLSLLYKNSDDEVSFAGAFGRAISLSRGVSGVVNNNLITNATLGIEGYYNYKSENDIDIKNNTLINCDSGIWLNTTALTNAVTVENNNIYLEADYQTPKFRVDYMSYGIALTGLDVGGLLSVKTNNITNYPVAIIAGSTRENTIYIGNNTINNCQIALNIANFIFGYEFKNSSTYLNVDINNTYHDCATVFKIDDFNANRFAKINFVIEQEETLSVLLKGKLNTPTIKLSSDKKSISWSNVVNNSGYDIYVDDVLYSHQETTVFALPTTLDNFTIKIKAVADKNNQLLLDSEFSNSFALAKIEKIEYAQTSLTNINETRTIIFADTDLHKLSDLLPISKNGYTYTGWKEETTSTEVDLQSAVTVSATYYVNWLKNFSLKLYLGDELLLSETIPVGSTPDLPTVIDETEVIAWYTNKNLAAKYLYTLQPCGANLNLYAKI